MADVEYKMFDKTSGKNGKARKCSVRNVLALILLVILIALVVFGLTVIYGLKLHCHDEDKTDMEMKSKNSKEIFSPLSFLLISDVHLDLQYKSMADTDSHCRNDSTPSTYKAPYGRIGCDSPMSLLKQVLHAMKKRASYLPKLDFIMLSGDTCAHHVETNRKQVVLETISTVSQEIKSVFPSTAYFPSIGNNDIPGHYVMPVEHDTWYADLLNIWQDAILCKDCGMTYQTTTVNELRRTFLYGGYYSVSIAGGNMSLLVLNSMYWTKSTWMPYDYFVERANTQLVWLEAQLKLAKSTDKKVILQSHIAPGIDIYVSQTLWMSNYTDLYMDLVANKYSDVVAGQIYAHFHRDSFRYLKPNKEEDASYILLMPSLSTVYSNNPNFRVVHLEPGLRAITDYEQYYMNLVMATEFNNPVWQLDYNFSSRYPPSGSDDQVINGKRIKKLTDNLINQGDDSYFLGYISSRQARYQPDPYSRFKYYCAVTYYSQNEFDTCMKKYLVPGG